MSEKLYELTEQQTEHPSNVHFQLHNHDNYEIYLFLEGDTQYVVEEKRYNLEPCDIILIRKHEMHRAYHNTPVRYHRMILDISPAFFAQHNCREYEAQFLDTAAGNGNKINTSLVRSSGLYDAFLRYKKYSDNYTADPNSPILTAIIIEILFLINRNITFSAPDLTGDPLKSVIFYLNNRYTEEITLELLEKKFFLSKYYICRAFRKSTGLTVHEYVNRKRLTRVRELIAEGLAIGDAAAQSGFNNYSSFYRAYLKEYGAAPREDLL